MQRRTFLKTLGTFAGAAALGTLPLPAPLAGTAQAKRKRAVAMTSTKAFCANNEAPAAVNELAPQALVIDYGEWCANPDIQYANGVKWLIHLQRHVPTYAELAAWAQHPAYSGKFFVGGNEEDLIDQDGNYSPFGALSDEDKAHKAAQVRILIVDQFSALLGFDQNIKLIVSAGSQMHAPQNTTNAFFPWVWNSIPDNMKDNFWGVCTHFYPFDVTSDPDEAFRPRTLATYLGAFKAAVGEMGLDRVFLREIGLPYEYRDDPRAAGYPQVVQNKCDEKGIKLWSWYAEQRYMGTPAEGYANLRDENGQITPLGESFRGVVSASKKK